jgi:peroxiredoxin/uncharacterized membrane protein YphA (DoxX/SURF4 family)
MTATTVFLALTRLSLLTAFAAAGFNKIGAAGRTREAMARFGVPKRLLRLVAVLLPLAELAVALGLAFRVTVHISAATALLLLSVFTAAVCVNLASGRTPDCACFGGIRPSPISLWTVGRNLILAAASTVLILSDPNRSFRAARIGAWQPAKGIALTIALGVSLAAIAWMALAWLHRSRSKVESLHRARRFTPRQETLATGTSAPAFELALLNGSVVTLESLARGGRSVLVTFVHPVCEQCAKMLPALAKIQKNHSDHLSAALVVSGDVDASRRFIGGHDITIVAADDKAHVAQLFRIPAVPSAVLIGPAGIISSETMIGARAVMGLINQVHKVGSP